MGAPITLPTLSHRFNREALSYYARLTSVLEYVETHISKPITLEDGASAAGLEKKYFSAFFHAKVGASFTEWIRLLRVERACKLMRDGDQSIIRIAFAAGFRDVRTLERAFKRYVGVTPTVYRTSVRPESRWLSQSSRTQPLS